MIKRLIPEFPINSKYKGICKVCKKDISKNDFISPFFDGENNYWRHTECLQLFYLDCLKYSSECAECETDINTGDMGYWSKHNGVWCIDCGEELFSYSYVSYSKDQYMKKITNNNQRYRRRYG